MTPMRWLYAAFWIFIAVVLGMQFNTYNSHFSHPETAAVPRQQHYYFLPNSNSTTNPASPLDPAIKPDGADVRQVGFTIDKDTPNQGNFTCHVVLKNVGNMKAMNVQVLVSPYRGIETANEDRGGSDMRYLTEDDQIVQNNSYWVSFPDMAPGESSTKDAVFINQVGYAPGDNSRPQIKFQSEKPKPSSNPAPVFPSKL